MRCGATEVFGIPGDFALPLFREIERCATLPLYTLSHEPGGGLGVGAVTYGASAFNLVNAVAGAYAERVPLVVLSTQSNTRRRRARPGRRAASLRRWRQRGHPTPMTASMRYIKVPAVRLSHHRLTPAAGLSPPRRPWSFKWPT